MSLRLDQCCGRRSWQRADICQLYLPQQWSNLRFIGPNYEFLQYLVKQQKEGSSISLVIWGWLALFYWSLYKWKPVSSVREEFILQGEHLSFDNFGLCQPIQLKMALADMKSWQILTPVAYHIYKVNIVYWSIVQLSITHVTFFCINWEVS